MRRNFDALLMDALRVEQIRSERAMPLQPRLTAAEGSRSANVPESNTGCSVKVEQVSDTRWILDRTPLSANTR